MRVTFLGTGAGLQQPDRGPAGILVDGGGTVLLLDCGPGCLQLASRAKVDMGGVAALLLSHLHPDHAGGLPELISHRGYSVQEPLAAVFGPLGTTEYLTGVLALVDAQQRVLGGAAIPHPKVMELRLGDRQRIGDLEVECVEVPHLRANARSRALAYRLAGAGKTVVYSGDTPAIPEVLARLAHKADLLVHECFTPDGLAGYLQTAPAERKERVSQVFYQTHSIAADVGRIAQESGVARLVLTHLLSTESEPILVMESRRWYGGEVLVARDGLTVEV